MRITAFLRAAGFDGFLSINGAAWRIVINAAMRCIERMHMCSNANSYPMPVRGQYNGLVPLGLYVVIRIPSCKREGP
jgi:hypothetical protein